MADRELIKGKITILIFFTVCAFFFFLSPIDANAYYGNNNDQNSKKRYELSGIISLEYERRWATGEDATSYFTQNYQLGLKGPVIDKRLATFDVSGIFISRSGDDTYRTSGINVNLSLLNSVNSVVKRYAFLLYMPKPISLNYSYYSGTDYTNTSYGISASYYLPIYFSLFSEGKLISVKSIFVEPVRTKFIQQNNQNINSNGNGNMINTNANGNQNNNNNLNANVNSNQQRARRLLDTGLRIPFPYFIFNYDKNIYESNSSRTETTSFDARARIGGRGYNYVLGYNTTTSEGTSSNDKTERISLNAQNIIKKFDVFTRLEYNTRNSESIFFFNSTARRSFYKDQNTTYNITLGVNYVNSEDSSVYTFSSAGNLSKRITPVLFSGTTASVTLINNNNDQRKNVSDQKGFSHSITLSENLQYSGVRGVILNGGMHIGITDDNIPYGISAGFTTTRWSRMTVSGSYSFSSEFSNRSDSSSKRHNLRLNVNGALLANIYGEIQYVHSITDVSNTDVYKETSDRIDIKANYYYRRHKLELTGYLAQVKNTQYANGKARNYGGTLNYSTYFVRNVAFYMGISYTEDMETGDSNTGFYSRLSVIYRKLTLSAEYTVSINDSGDSSKGKKTEHKLYVKASRRFNAKF